MSLIERRKGLFGSHSLRSQNDVSVHDHFVNLLKHVVQQPSSYPFMVPVDAEALGLADYHDVVKAPMDLGTVERRLGGLEVRALVPVAGERHGGGSGGAAASARRAPRAQSSGGDLSEPPPDLSLIHI